MQPLPQHPDFDGGPRFPLARLAAHSIHRNSQLTVGPLPAEFTNDFYGTRMSITRVPAGSHASDTDFGVPTAIPVQCDDRLVGLIIKIDHDFLD
jgi:hypothetical protein